jgi:hypothetical protein
LNETIQNITARQRVEKVINKKEWKFKKILILLLILNIFWSIYDFKTIDYKNNNCGWRSKVAAAFYLYSDLKTIIITNNANKKA